MWSDVWSGDFVNLDKSNVIRDTECPYWNQVLLNNTNPTQPDTVAFLHNQIYVDHLLD